jgi:cytidyltransferase-like protein
MTGGSILVTRSEAGMSFVPPVGEAAHMPTQARAVFDVAGAGDTVAAAFALAFASGRPVAEAMAFTNLAAGIAVSKPGTTVVQADDLEAERGLLVADGLVDKGALADWETAVRLRSLWQRQGLIVGFTNGCFDLLQPGHMALLRETAKACDKLIVGLNSDASARRLKGPGRCRASASVPPRRGDRQCQHRRRLRGGYRAYQCGYRKIRFTTFYDRAWLDQHFKAKPVSEQFETDRSSVLFQLNCETFKRS